MMTMLPSRESCIEAIVSAVDERSVIVGTTGMPSRELFECRARKKAGHQRDFLTVGGMGHASSIAAGIALGMGRPEEEGGEGHHHNHTSSSHRKVVCLDGDGAALMHLGAMPVLGGLHMSSSSSSGPSSASTTSSSSSSHVMRTGINTRLLHIVVNNGAHDSVGGQPTVGKLVDLPRIAEAAGYYVYRHPNPLSTVAEMEEGVKAALACVGGSHGKPVFMEIMCKKGNRPDLGRPTTTPLQNKDGLMQFIREA